jgi:hypothetical protein
MAARSLLNLMVLCWNEGVYLQNLIPQLLTVADKVVVVDGNSTDFTKDYILSIKDPRLEFYQREFDICAKQFDFALSKCTKNDTWVFNCTADELPTKWWFGNIRNILDTSDAMGIDRLFSLVFHLRGERTMSSEMGCELRIFRNDEHHKCFYTDYPHERLEGQFDGDCCREPNREFAFVHFKQADPSKIHIWKNDYVEKGVYSLWDINRRLDFPTIQLPEYINYEVNSDLRRYLGWYYMLKIFGNICQY